MSDEIVGQWWSESDGSVGLLPETPLHKVLRWIIMQLHYGNFQQVMEEDGRPDTLMVGRAAAPEATADQWVDQHQKRSWALSVSRILANARESGVEPEHLELAETARFTANENAAMNTEFHYALELMDVLATIRARTFELVNLPLVGKASKELIALVREATRCHLFGLHKACAALCRAGLEQALKEQVSPGELAAERATHRNSGDLECLINIAGRRRLLDTTLIGYAHAVRRKGNDVMHGHSSEAVADSVIVFADTRLLIERLFATK